MKNETVRIRIRLTEEEKEKLERDAALCGLSQAEDGRDNFNRFHGSNLAVRFRDLMRMRKGYHA